MSKHARVVVAAALSTLGLAATVAAAPAAHAASFTITSQAEVTSTIKRTGQKVTFPVTTSTATITPGTETTPATISSTLDLQPATTSMRLGSLDLVTITLQSVATAPTTGTIDVDGPVWHVDATQPFRIRILKISPAGLPRVNLVRSGCQSGATSAALTGTIDFSEAGQPGGPGDYWLRGSYRIPAFSHCGLLLDGLLTSLVSGRGNSLDAHFTG
jgi:outer membrane receptor protein involved in Fe transport